jgi:hypothetical protein
MTFAPPGASVSPDLHEAPVADAHGVDDRTFVVHRVDRAVHEQQLSLFIVAPVRTPVAVRRRGNRYSERGRHRCCRLKESATR